MKGRSVGEAWHLRLPADEILGLKVAGCARDKEGPLLHEHVIGVPWLGLVQPGILTTKA